MIVAELNLPAPSPYLIDLVRQTGANAPINPDNKRWLDEFHNGEINSSLHLFGISDEKVDQQVLLEYQKFFPKHKIRSGVSIMKSLDNTVSCQPPHIDRGRALAVNYFIDLGGNNVETVLYNISAEVKKIESTNLLYKDARDRGIVHKQIFPVGWYAFNVKQAHSVENIQSTRLFFSIKFSEVQTTYDLDQLLNDYPELIKNPN